MNTTMEPNTALVLSPAFELDSKSADELNAAFTPIHAEALKWVESAKLITITDASQLREMKLAREYRLGLKSVRLAAEKKHRELKEGILRRGRAIDGVKNIILDLIAPAETHLLEQEKFAERLEEKRKQDLKAHREALLLPFSVNVQFYALGDMPDAEFSALYDNAKAAHEAKIAAAKKAEDDRIALEKAEAQERERIRLENEALKKKAIELEAAALAESKRVEAEKKAAEDKARKEREEVERKAKAEREAAEAAALAEKQARERVEAELKARKDAEESDAKAKSDAEKKAAKAPDQAKVRAFADAVRGLVVPQMSTPGGEATAEILRAKRAEFANWIEKQAEAL